MPRLLVKRRAHAFLAALLAAHAALAWHVRQREIFVFGDDAAYILLARSLRSFAYRELQYFGEPTAARFPPVYPGLLAVWTALFGETVSAIAVLGIIASVLTLLAMFVVIRRRWSEELALLVVAVTAVNPTFVTMAGATASEAAFTAFAMGALWAADQSDDAGASTRSSAGAVGLSILAALTRSAGVTLVAALGLHWLLRRRWRRVILLGVVSAATVGAWLGWTVFAPQREVRRSYVDDAVTVRTGDGSLLGTFAHRIQNNVSAYAGQTVATELQLPLTSKTRLDNVAWLAVAGSLMLVGLASTWRRWNAAALFGITYAGLLAIWAYNLERFVAPVIPLIILLVIAGVWALAERKRGGAGVRAATVAAALLAVFALVRDRAYAEQAADCDLSRSDCAFPAAIDYIDAVKYIATNTPGDARVMTPKAATMFYYAHRQSSFWEEIIAVDSASFRPYLRDHGIRYVLAAPVFSDYRVVYTRVHQQCEYFDVVKAFSQETVLFAVRDTPREDARRAPACVYMARALDRPLVQ